VDANVNLDLGGEKFFIALENNFSWAGISGPITTIQGNLGNWGLITPFANGTVYIGGNFYVGLPSGFGSANLFVRGTVTSNGVITSAGSPVPRWLGRLSADPAQRNAGDTYWNTTTSKARLWNGTGWVDIN